MADKREKMRRPAPLSDLVNAAFSGTPTERRLKEGNIWLVWDSVVGKQIAGRARPVSFRDGTLTVAVNSSPWMQQLTFLKKGIMEKLNSRLGEALVRDIYLKAGAQPRPDTRGVTMKTFRALTDAEKKRIAELSASVDDQELRVSLEGLYAKHLSAK